MADSTPIKEEINTVRDCLQLAMSRFEEADIYCGHGTDSLWDEAIYLVFGALNLPFDSDESVLERRLTNKKCDRVVALIEKRCADKIPTAYLIQEAWFCGLPFYVDERVLIPRSPMAELIENGFQPWIDENKVTRILDLCAGSGCIGIACAVVFPEASVDLADISEDALAVAQTNIDKHGLNDQVCAIESDLFSALGDARYDVIISNPPYVDAAEMAALPAEYRHEPELGLAAGKDGLDIVKRILREASQHLTPHGILIVEVGASEAALVEQYPDVPFMWLEFENGGRGVFLLTAQQLTEFFK